MAPGGGNANHSFLESRVNSNPCHFLHEQEVCGPMIIVVRPEIFDQPGVDSSSTLST